MIRSLSRFFTGITQRWLPDAFIIAIILTFVVLLGGVLGENQSISNMAKFWGDGVWDLLIFSMQVILTLVTGSVMAQTSVIKNGLRKLASVAKTPGQAIMLMTMIALVSCWINWGFGLITSALMAKEVARQVKGVHYPLLVASAYSGMLVWHAGLSGTIPLKIAVSDGDVIGSFISTPIPLTETIFSWEVILICLVLLATLPIIYRLMIPEAKDIIEILPETASEPEDTAKPCANTPASRIENNRLPVLFLGCLSGYYLIIFFLDGGKFGLNSVNFIFLTMGLLLHRSAISYLAAFNEAVKGLTGIILQFPIYAGIMGMMVHSGLAASMSEWFISISTVETFTVYTFISSGIVNFFVPSGGGQWAVQAPIVIPAAQSLGVPINQAAMAVAFGDAWTNMIQPFWALPLLGIAQLGIKDIMGYCTVALIWSGIVYVIAIIYLF